MCENDCTDTGESEAEKSSANEAKPRQTKLWDSGDKPMCARSTVGNAEAGQTRPLNGRDDPTAAQSRTDANGSSQAIPEANKGNAGRDFC